MSTNSNSIKATVVTMVAEIGLLFPDTFWKYLLKDTHHAVGLILFTLANIALWTGSFDSNRGKIITFSYFLVIGILFSLFELIRFSKISHPAKFLRGLWVITLTEFSLILLCLTRALMVIVR